MAEDTEFLNFTYSKAMVDYHIDQSPATPQYQEIKRLEMGR